MTNLDIKCPNCGTVNRHLDLEETQGYMECECCQKVVGIPKYIELYKQLFISKSPKLKEATA